MVCYKRIPTVDEGVGVLFDTSETMQVLLGNIIEGVDLDDKYLFIIDMDTQQFRAYYKAVIKKCEEINELLCQEDGINEAVVFPKLMYLFHNLESCYYLKDYFNNAPTPEEVAQAELAYQSTDSIIMTLDISERLF